MIHKQMTFKSTHWLFNHSFSQSLNVFLSTAIHQPCFKALGTQILTDQTEVPVLRKLTFFWVWLITEYTFNFFKCLTGDLWVFI